MVDWTDKERSTITGVWGKINVDEIGPQALARYSSTAGYFNFWIMHTFVYVLCSMREDDKTICIIALAGC